MGIILLIILLGCLTFLNYRLIRSVLYPPFVFCAMWLLVFLVYEGHFIEVNSLHKETLALVGAGAFLFSLGGALGLLIPRQMINWRLRIGDCLNDHPRTHLLKYLLVIGFFVGLIFSAHELMIAGAQGTGPTILARARNAGVEAQNAGTAAVSFLTYVPIWSACITTLFLIEQKDRLFWVMATIAFIIAVLTTGRVPILLLFCALVTVHLVKTGKLNAAAALKFARVPILIFLFFYLVLVFTNKDTSNLSGGVGGILIYFVVSYLIGPTVALDYVLQHPNEYANLPNHTFKFPLQIASSLHLIQYTPPPLLDSFLDVPFPTNVYTGYKFFFTDFGIWGCLAILGTIGFLHTLLYRKALSSSALGLYMLALMMMPLVMFIFDDLYSATGELLNIILLGCLYMIVRPLRVLPARKTKAATSLALNAGQAGQKFN